MKISLHGRDIDLVEINGRTFRAGLILIDDKRISVDEVDLRQLHRRHVQYIGFTVTKASAIVDFGQIPGVLRKA